MNPFSMANHSTKRICVIGEVLLELLPADESVRFDTFGHMIKSPSGAAGIFACAAAALGGEVSLIARLGTDPFSAFVLDAVRRYGVDTSRVAHDQERQAGLAFVEEVANRRRFVYYRKNSAGSTLGAADIDPTFIRSLRALYFPAMLLGLSDSMRSACLAALAAAKNAGVIAAIDLNMRRELWPERDDNLLKQVIAQVDLLTLNLHEACLITGAGDPQAALDILLGWGPDVVAITLGDSGVIVGTQDKRAIIAGLPVTAVDTVGAGDVFAAGLLVGLLDGMDIAAAGNFANTAAALKASRLGAIGRGIPRKEEVSDFMNAVVGNQQAG